MSVAGGAPVEYGRCVGCDDWVWGPWFADLTASIALVLHCRPPESNTPHQGDDRATMVGPTAQEDAP